MLLWLAGRLEIEREQGLLSEALATLREYVKARPAEEGVAEIESDAEIFERALRLHLTRGDASKNHFLENVKATRLVVADPRGTRRSTTNRSSTSPARHIC